MLRYPLVFLLLWLCSLVACRTRSNYYAYPVSPKREIELAFGIEFNMDHLISSVTLGNDSTYGLARVHGGEAYQSLMRHYLETCHHINMTQDPPVEEMRQAYAKGASLETARSSKYIRQMNSWWDFVAVWIFKQPEVYPEAFDGDDFTGDREVQVLAQAVESLKSATLRELNQQFNFTDQFPRAYTGIAMPDFFFTISKPQPDLEMQPDGRVTWQNNFDFDSVWFRAFFKKFTTALYRNKFRLDGSAKKSDLGHIKGSSTYTRDILPSSFEAMYYTKEQDCIDDTARPAPATDFCGIKAFNSTSIIINFSNASLSLLLEGRGSDWTPWNTFTELGGHILSRSEGGKDVPTKHRDRVLAKIDALGDKVDVHEKHAVDLILIGESWDEKSVTSFKERVASMWKDRTTEINNIIHQPDVFAASKASAIWGRSAIDNRDEGCQLPASEMLPLPPLNHTNDEL